MAPGGPADATGKLSVGDVVLEARAAHSAPPRPVMQPPEPTIALRPPVAAACEIGRAARSAAQAAAGFARLSGQAKRTGAGGLWAQVDGEPVSSTDEATAAILGPDGTTVRVRGSGACQGDAQQLAGGDWALRASAC